MCRRCICVKKTLYKFVNQSVNMFSHLIRFLFFALVRLRILNGREQIGKEQ